MGFGMAMEFGADIPARVADMAIRSVILAAAAMAVIYLLRVRTAAARHAVWTVVTAAMLLLPAIGLLSPSIPLRVLRAARGVQRVAQAVAQPAAYLPDVRTLRILSVNRSLPNPAPAPHRFTWQQAVAAVYAAGLLVFLSQLAVSYSFTRRLVRAGTPLELSGASGVCESNWISVPVTAGFWKPKILLPATWREWPAEKLAAVMTHEQVHVRRADWAIAMLAGLNRRLFWFHPLAWWLERQLASLAEQACDDAALLALGERESYAQVLLDMAAAVRSGRGRMIWEATAMAKTAEVRKRIDRILDETRQIPRGLTRSRWAALVACSLPLVYMASVMQLAPAQPFPQMSSLTPQAVSALERRLLTNPDDLAARGQLIANYYLTGVQHPRLDHIFWLIEHHPETSLAAFNSAAILPGNTPMNGAADYAKAATLWRQQTAIHTTDATVLGNAAQFFAQPGGDPYEAERLLRQAAAVEPQNSIWTDRLAKLYASAILAAAGYPEDNPAAANPEFAETAKTVLQSSTGELRLAAGNALNPQALRPDLPRPTMLARYPQLEPVFAMGRDLSRGSALFSNAAGDALPAQAGASVRLSIPNVDASLLQRVTPVYPEQARQAGVQGDVRLSVKIGMDGRVQSAEPIEGNPLLALAAQDAVMQYVYQPYTLDGRPQEVQTTVTVPFHPDTAASASELPAMGFPAIGLRTGPAFLSRQAAEYTEEARQAKLEGAVTLTLTFGADGKTHDVRVVKSLGLGLDEKAVEAARKWTFRPAYQDGNPVDYPTTVTMSFHLVPAAPGALEIARKSKSGPQDAHQVILTPDPTVMAATKSYFIVSPSPGVTLPLLVSKTDPEYSELARNAKYQGTLTMSVSIGADGAMHGVRVLKSLGLGLDEKGIEAVKQWKFQPAYQDGKPIPYTATIQVEFRLI